MACPPMRSGTRCAAQAAMGHTAYHHVGDVSGPMSLLEPSSPDSFAVMDFWSFARLALVGAAAFHGYRRNNSVAWAIGWAVLAGGSPAIVTGIAIAQGFGKPKKGS